MNAEVETLQAAEGEILTVTPESAVDVPSDPYERARGRLSRLESSFASALSIIADMYQDEDWKYLTREDGSEYTTLSEVLADVMQLSLSMARRYVQAGRDFYLPLSDMTVDGTRIPITSGDVAALGSDGLAEVVDVARERLSGVDDPAEAEGIIGDSVREVREGKSKKVSGDVESDFDGYDPGTTATKKSAKSAPETFPGDGAGTAAEDADWNAADDDMSGLPAGDAGSWGDDGDWLPSSAPVGSESESASILDDPVERVLSDADDYHDLEKLEALPEPVRSVAAALRTLAGVDVQTVAAAIDYDKRGVLTLAQKAASKVSRLRAATETQAWFVSRLVSAVD